MLARTLDVLEKVFIDSWWVVIFFVICYSFYEQGLKKSKADFTMLNEQYKNLNQQKEEALALQENLLLQLNSQSDPAWIERILMKGLGVIPEGQTKILFIKQHQTN